MRIRKRIVASVTGLVLLFNMFTPVFGTTSFPDVAEGAWYQESVEAVSNAGIIVGNAQGEFMPMAMLNVDQFVKTIVVAISEDVGNGDQYWASKYMDKARELDLINGDEYMNQDQSTVPITRGQMSKIISKVVFYLEDTYEFTNKEAIVNYIPDKASVVASGYKDYIYQIYELGIITGDQSGAYKPNNTVSRAEAAVVIHRIIEPSVRIPFINPTSATGITYSTTEFEAIGVYASNTHHGATVDIDLYLPSQYDEISGFLTSYVSDGVKDEVIEYIKEKVDREQVLDPVFWEEGNIKVRVISRWLTNDITINLWEFKQAIGLA